MQKSALISFFDYYREKVEEKKRVEGEREIKVGGMMDERKKK